MQRTCTSLTVSNLCTGHNNSKCLLCLHKYFLITLNLSTIKSKLYFLSASFYNPYSFQHLLHHKFGEGNGTPLQYSCLENPVDGGAWQAAVPGVAKGWTQLSDFTFTFHFHALEKEMATHSSVLAWRVPGTGEPSGLPSTGSHRVGHD